MRDELCRLSNVVIEDYVGKLFEQLKQVATEEQGNSCHVRQLVAESICGTALTDRDLDRIVDTFNDYEVICSRNDEGTLVFTWRV